MLCSAVAGSAFFKTRFCYKVMFSGFQQKKMNKNDSKLGKLF